MYAGYGSDRNFAAELAELKKLVNGKLDQATMERLIDWKHHQ